MKNTFEEWDSVAMQDLHWKQMRILLIDVNCKYTSTGKIVYDLFTNLKANSHKAAICYGRGPLIREKGIYKFGLDWETYLHAALSRITGLNGCFSILSTIRLIRFIDRFQPDVIHIHELHAYFVNIKLLIEHIKRKKIKVVWTFHCEYMYTGKCGHANDCSKFEKGCGHCPELHEYPKSLLFDQTRKMFRMKKELLSDLDMTIVCPSEWLADRVRKSFLKDKNIMVIHNGVNTDIFHPVDGNLLKKNLGIPKENKVVLSVAPNIMSERKGGKWVLKLADEMKDEKVTFVLVGGDEHKMTAVDSRKNIIYIGAVSCQKELTRYYSMADVFLICSSKETFSMTCAESICCGTPVVGFRCGAPETIFEEPYAVFVEYGSMRVLKEKLIEKLSGEMAHVEFVEKYGFDKLAFLHMYQKLINVYKTFEEER